MRGSVSMTIPWRPTKKPQQTMQGLVSMTITKRPTKKPQQTMGVRSRIQKIFWNCIWPALIVFWNNVSNNFWIQKLWAIGSQWGSIFAGSPSFQFLGRVRPLFQICLNQSRKYLNQKRFGTMGTSYVPGGNKIFPPPLRVGNSVNGLNY